MDGFRFSLIHQKLQVLRRPRVLSWRGSESEEFLLEEDIKFYFIFYFFFQTKESTHISRKKDIMILETLGN
jgi:hypothetical protein